MGDKSPKSKKRDQQQKAVVKKQQATDARAKQSVAATVPGKVKK